ncbi:hypothetical protein FRX31_034689, partial [Thalictrum thalictroides]
MCEGDEEKKQDVCEGDKEKKQDVDINDKEKNHDVVVGGLTSIAKSYDLLDSIMSDVQELPLLNRDHNGDMEMGEDNDDGTDGFLYQEALKDFNLNQ